MRRQRGNRLERLDASGSWNRRGTNRPGGDDYRDRQDERSVEGSGHGRDRRQ
jgi:hypothetical protein